MKEKQVFFNPFRLISPKLNAEASRLEELYEAPPVEVTCLEEGLLVMFSKLVDMTESIYKSLIMYDPEKLKKCEQLATEIHGEEKNLTGDLVCSPATTGDVLRTLVLFPGRLERVGDLLESIGNVARIRARDGIPFSDKALAELAQLFSLFIEALKNCRDIIVTTNPTLLAHVAEQQKKVAQMTLDFALAHEDRLLEGLCSPKASSLYLDILDSVKGANEHLTKMVEALLRLDESHPPGIH